MGSSPLTVHKLRAILIAEKIRPSNYNLGHVFGDVVGDDECYHLEQRNGKWAVYYSERGSEHGLQMFETESAACAYLLDRLRSEWDARLPRRWEEATQLMAPDSLRPSVPPPLPSAMPSLVCVPITVHDPHNPDTALALAAQAKTAGADLVEFRIDELFTGDLEAPAGGPHPSVLAIDRLVAECPLPCIVTCRSASEGGGYDGDETDRVSLYERLGTAEPGHAPTYLDFELAAYTRSANIKQKINLAVRHPAQQREVGPSLILSSHDFQGRPADLTRRVLAMQAEPACAVAKIAFKARSLRDNLELFELLAHRDKPMIALAMGEFGLMSRVLAPKFGGLLTFAALRPAETTAPGQPTVRDLLSLYRFREINAATRVYGIIGWPVAHSKSPLVQNAAFEAAGHNAVYLPLPIPTPDGPHSPDDAYLVFKATLLDLVHDPRLTFSGASVTIPHKEHLLRLAREQSWSIDPIAAAVGAANTLTITRTASNAFASASISNTDVPGLVGPLREAFPSLKGLRAAVLGAGGAARAAAYGLLREGAHVTIHNRDLAKARAVADDLAPHIANGTPAPAIAPLETIDPAAFDLCINCTPVGMKSGPAPDQSPIPVSRFIPQTATQTTTQNRQAIPLVLDTVYTPAQTPLLQAAQHAGWRTIDGVHMFVRQATLQFHTWTGQLPPPGLFDRLVRGSHEERVP
jgi:3-dehydroquinate dehydratase / shikimate dehydrogenase